MLMVQPLSISPILKMQIVSWAQIFSGGLNKEVVVDGGEGGWVHVSIL
tara:strand:+ start:385 stop:528 length:144 start_codon:yes stop_codon:yes gene_type:complete